MLKFLEMQTIFFLEKVILVGGALDYLVLICGNRLRVLEGYTTP
jgi:hypothetical protein